MNRGKFTKIILSLILSVWLFGATATLAQTNDINVEVPKPRVIIPGLDFTSPDKLTTIEQDPITDEFGNRLVYVPFIGDYIAALYKYAVLTASVLAMVMIVIAGFEWTASGGNTETIGNAKKRINGAVIGLLIAAGSYMLLYSLNPELVQFRALKINYVLTRDDTEIGAFDRGEAPLGLQVGGGKYSKKSSGGIKPGRKTTKVVDETFDAAAAIIRHYSEIPSTSVTKDRSQCPLMNADKRKLSEPYDAPTSPQPLTYNKFDEILQRYGNCIDNPNADWRVLKAIAYMESGHFAIGSAGTKKNPIGFSGLFQTNPRYCKSILTHAPSVTAFDSNWCTYSDTGLYHPEVSTMVGVKFLNIAYEQLKNRKCDNVTGPAMIFYSFVNHQSGTAVLIELLRRMSESGIACSDYKNPEMCKLMVDSQNAKGDKSLSREDTSYQVCEKITALP